MDAVKNLIKIKKNVPSNVKIIAVSKTYSTEKIMQLYNYGHTIFGENRVQELLAKYNALPKDIEWHMIGHLQSNKVKYIAPFISLIHSVDSKKLLYEINKRAKQNNRIIDCLLQIHIAKEESKYGLSFYQAEELIKDKDLSLLNNVRLCGLMGMATNTSNLKIIKNEFKALKDFFNKIKNKYFANINYFKELSMGMSNDYKIAIEEGSTMLRIGSAIFGSRK